ncbi:MAG: hypothetical protein R3C44_20715 [Chloroflexota bacterium]
MDREALLNAVRLTNAYLLNNHAETYTFATLFAGLLDPVTGRLLTSMPAISHRIF